MTEANDMPSDDRIRCSITRHFLPGVLALIAGALVLTGVPRLEGWLLLGMDIGMLALGYGLTLKVGRRFVRRLSGIRGVAAGLWAPLVAQVGLMTLRWTGIATPASTFSIFAGSAVTMFAAGAFSAATMFIRRRRGVPESREPAALPGESLEQWFHRVEREAERKMRRIAAAFPGLRAAIRRRSAVESR